MSREVSIRNMTLLYQQMPFKRFQYKCAKNIKSRICESQSLCNFKIIILGELLNFANPYFPTNALRLKFIEMNIKMK